MITVATNQLDKLSTTSRAELEKNIKSLFKIEEDFTIGNYLQKDIKIAEKNKFFLGNLPLKDLVEDINKWQSFSGLINNIFNYFSHDIKDVSQIEFWITSLTTPIPINIFFAVSNLEEIDNKMQSLRDTLNISKVFQGENIKKGEIALIGYDEKGNAWRLNYL